MLMTRQNTITFQHWIAIVVAVTIVAVVGHSIIGIKVAAANPQNDVPSKQDVTLERKTNEGLPIRPENARAGAAYDVLKKHCARCHQANTKADDPVDVSRTEVAGRIANILEIDAIAREAHLVRPGHPDASPLYLSMLTQVMPPLHVSDETLAQTIPTTAEIRAIRQWIADLPKQASSCDGERTLDPAKLAPEMKVWLASRDKEIAKDTRFISMLALYNGCRTAKERRLYFQAVSDVLNRVSQNGRKVSFHLLGEDKTILAFRLSQIGWTPEDWKVVIANPPGFSLITQSSDFDHVIAATRTIQPVVPAAWLAERLRVLGELDVDEPGSDGPSERLLGLNLVAGLARHGALAVDLEMAAAELGVTREVMASRLDAVTGPAHAAARYLARRGVLKRETFSRVAREVAYGSAEARTIEPSGELFLWTDKLKYKVGDLAVVYAATTANCFLTVFGIDGSGLTTVLFPNDFDRDNKLVPGRVIRVPEETAPFQLRINNLRPETIVGVCTPETRDPPAVTHTFSRQRFTILGQWEDFLDTSLKAERKARKRQRSNGRKETERTPKRTVPEPQIRAAITLYAE